MSDITKKYVDYAGLSEFKTLSDSLMDAKISAMETFTGASSSSDGAAGLVPAPDQGEQEKFVRGDGEWALTPSEIFTGTSTAWGNLSTAQKAKYKLVVLNS